MKPLLLARFTPSLTAPEDLEEIFVQRGPLAERLMAQLQDSLTTANKHHTLLVGPRGIGKTHLISLVYNRLVRREDLRPLCIIAWLREEEWGIMSFLDLLLRILRSLSENREVDIPAERMDALHKMAPREAEAAAVELLNELIGKKTLVLLVENLDDIFKGLAQREQGAFRAFIQDRAFVTILATTPGLFEGVSRKTSPFFGFFHIYHLDELKLEEAAQLLYKIARRRGQNDLAAFILTPTGRARIRAIHHLAQGNPRVYVILSEFLTRNSLDDLIDPVLRMLDDLTPYYQSRLAALSPQQRKIVDFLASHRSPTTVKEIAQKSFISPQTASGQLKKLSRWGYVRSEAIGRESYYELREPLMRYCLDLKRERKEPLRPLVEILRIWLTEDELQVQLHSLGSVVSPMAQYLKRALDQCRQQSDDPRVEACRRDFQSHIDKDEYKEAISVAEDWIAISRNFESLSQHGFAAEMAEQWELARQSLSAAVALGETDFFVFLMAATSHFECALFPEALDLINKAIEAVGDDSDRELLSLAIVVKAETLSRLGHSEEAIACCKEVPETNDQGMNSRILRIRSESFLALGRFEDVKNVLGGAEKRVLESNSDLYWALGAAQFRSGELNESLIAFDRSLAIGDSAGTRLSKAAVLSAQGRWGDVFSEIDRALILSTTLVSKWRPTLLAILSNAISAANLEEILSTLNQALEMNGIQSVDLSEVLIFASKALLKHPKSAARSLRFSDLFERLSKCDKPRAFSILPVLFKFLKNGDSSAFLLLPLEERRMITEILADDDLAGRRSLSNLGTDS